MIAVVTSPAGIDQQDCHELSFDDIHIYKSQPQRSQNRTQTKLPIAVMIITEEQQQTSDLDWFCVDSAGLIGHFASAGFKRIPPSVACSGEDLDVLTSFFLQLRPLSSGHELDAHLPPNCRSARYLQSFVSMARRGLFSFDIDSYLKPDICYFRVALPLQPLRISELPDHVRTILTRTELKEMSFADSSTIPYAVTLSL
ncbi:hypothetical protein [Occallatibacter savannae]|uniref:hypothetical protein n=1 Tax=Occallatibacter savannae TaxID=1002691 RepID=UPI0013A5AEB9|nr:hypothetical protein [Occallatibacter savannae]